MIREYESVLLCEDGEDRVAVHSDFDQARAHVEQNSIESYGVVNVFIQTGTQRALIEEWSWYGFSASGVSRWVSSEETAKER